MILVPKLTLMTQRKDDDMIRALVILVQGQITGAAARDHQFPKNTVYWSTDRGIGAQDLQPTKQQIVGLKRDSGLLIAQELDQPFEIGAGSLRNDYLCHWRSFGLRDLLP